MRTPSRIIEKIEALAAVVADLEAKVRALEIEWSNHDGFAATVTAKRLLEAKADRNRAVVVLAKAVADGHAEIDRIGKVA